jgi:alpha-amylase
MASVCFYFQVHQPNRLRRYSVFDTEPNYFDDQRNRQILEKVASKCYVPATELILDLIEKHQGQFRVAYSLTGSVIEQFRQWCPQMLNLIERLANSGCVEFLGETYNHSLAFMYSRDEFCQQVQRHRELIQDLTGQSPKVFRNTELIYNNELAKYIAETGDYHGVICEGTDHILDGRSPNALYHAAGNEQIKVLLKNYKLSDDIAFRFSNRDCEDYPLTAQKFTNRINQINVSSKDEFASGQQLPGQVCNLFMDYETFGEHQWEETGIFKFLEALPDALLDTSHDFESGNKADNGGARASDTNDFKTPSECIQAYEAPETFDVPDMISWADTERDVSAWLGNAMQSNALHELYEYEQPIKTKGDAQLLDDWRTLTTSDHFYYMCTKYFADGDVHKYFNPYESPYDSYINFMNVLDNLRARVEGNVPAKAVKETAKV